MGTDQASLLLKRQLQGKHSEKKIVPMRMMYYLIIIKEPLF